MLRPHTAARKPHRQRQRRHNRKQAPAHRLEDVKIYHTFLKKFSAVPGVYLYIKVHPGFSRKNYLKRTATPPDCAQHNSLTGCQSGLLLARHNVAEFAPHQFGGQSVPDVLFANLAALDFPPLRFQFCQNEFQTEFCAAVRVS